MPYKSIYHMLIELQLIRSVVQGIEEVEDHRSDESRAQALLAYQRILTRCSSVADKRDWRSAPKEELIAQARTVYEDVCLFVQSAICFYRSVRSQRALSPNEVEQGQRLRELVAS